MNSHYEEECKNFLEKFTHDMLELQHDFANLSPEAKEEVKKRLTPLALSCLLNALQGHL